LHPECKGGETCSYAGGEEEEDYGCGGGEFATETEEVGLGGAFFEEGGY